MKEDIINFPKQLLYNPKINNEKSWGSYGEYILAGMGGSHLQADIFLSIFSEFPLLLHQDYGLPARVQIRKNSAVLASSYSGNTEETLDALKKAISLNIPTGVISKGGKALEIAKENDIPFIEIPESGVQPRLAIGYSFKALLKMLSLESCEKDIEKVSCKIEERMEKMEKTGKEVANFLQNKVPIIYSSQRNKALSKIWKINFNETSKVPSFYNVFPELNHNEMTGFDKIRSTENLSGNMAFLNLWDEDDFQKNIKRNNVLKEVLEKRDFSFKSIKIEGETRTEKVFSGVVISMWSAFYLSSFYGTEPSQVPMVEEFKQKI